VAQVCSSLDLQLTPLRWRVRLGILVLTFISLAGTLAKLGPAWPETTTPAGVAGHVP
jgi:hypothetical protein